MTIALEKLSMALSEQFASLTETVYRSTNTNNQNSKEYIIDGLAVKVLVNLKCKSIDPGIPVEKSPGLLKKYGIPVGKKSSIVVKKCRLIANVTINPKNETVANMVATFFHHQMMPAMYDAPQFLLFDEVVINDKKII